MDDSSSEQRFARFRAELGLPAADEQLARDASAAVRQEYRDCSKWKRLDCQKVSVVAERDLGTVFVLHVDRSVEFDWTWEGAIAFRPMSFDDDRTSAAFDAEHVAYEVDNTWSGEILEVDEERGCLLISVDETERPPTTGTFFVRPFEFMGVLDAVYHEPAFEEIRAELPRRLAAASGAIHPPVCEPSEASLPELQEWWNHSWCVLWGPPGTGKTWTTGRQIAAVLSDPTERILVVSTTNRATDAVALSIGEATRERGIAACQEGKLLRVGKGAAMQTFVDRDLDTMLRGTEADTLQRIGELTRQLERCGSLEEKALVRKSINRLRAGGGDRSRQLFVDADVRVVVSTAFQAMCVVKQQAGMLVNGLAPFTTLFIDEAGLMSRSAIAVLSLLAARRVVLVGDSRQLAPISRVARLMPMRQQAWLASSGVSHLDDLHTTPDAVHVLREQRRMHPAVCQVVSSYQYDGVLQTSPDIERRESRLPRWLREHSRAIWYVLDEESDVDLADLRAERGPGNASWVRPITPVIVEKILQGEGLPEANGLFVSPFKAQAQAMSDWFAKEGFGCWEASTVHSQQGVEADVVIFDTVNAGNYTWPYEEWKRLVNVALSRAREAVIVLASRAEMEEPYLRPLIRTLTPSVVVEGTQGVQWRTVNQPDVHRVAVSTASYSPKSSGANMGEQIGQRRHMRPTLSREQQRLVGLKLDGKPRLVRGVAGSGKSIVLCHWLARTVRRLRDEPHVRIWAVYANRSLHQLLRESIEAAWRDLSAGELFDRSDFPWEKVALLHVRDVFAAILPTAALAMQDFEFDYDRAAEEFLNRQDVAELLPRCTAMFVDEAQDMGASTLRLLLSMVEASDEDDPNSRPAHIFHDHAQNLYSRKPPRWADFGLDLRGRSTILRESFRSTKPITELAVNVLYRLLPLEESLEDKLWFDAGLLEKCQRDGQEWLQVEYSQVDGPKPVLRTFSDRQLEFDAIARHLKHVIEVEKISASDICLLYNGKAAVRLLKTRLAPIVREWGIELSVQTNRSFERRENTLIVTTPQSYKGYEAELVMIPCVDQFIAGGTILANSLYVAMTRARALLAIYGVPDAVSGSQQLCDTIADCLCRL